MTTELSQHAKTILQAMIDDKDIQFITNTGTYTTCDRVSVFYHLQSGNECRLRVKPDTCKINGIEFQAPSDKLSAQYSIIIVASGTDTRKFHFDELKDVALASNALYDALAGNSK